MVWGKSSAHLSRVVEPLLTEWGRLLLAVGSVCKMAWGKLCAHPSRAVEPLLTGWGKLSALADVHQDDSPPYANVVAHNAGCFASPSYLLH